MELPNGLRVVLLENRASPYLQVELAFAIGAAADPADQIGLASITGRLLTAGIASPTDLDEDGLARALARIGAHLNVDVSRDTLTVSGHLPALADADVRHFLALLVGVVRRATLPADHLARELAQRSAQIEAAQDDPATLADVAIRLAVLGDGPHAWPTFGTLATVPNITATAVRRWRDLALVPAHAVLVVAGAFEPAPLAGWLDANLGDTTWGAGVRCTPGIFPGTCATLCLSQDCLANPSAAPRPPPAAPTGPRADALYVTTPDAGMTQIQWRAGVGNPIAAASPDYAALRLGLHVLGGDFASRLNAHLRTREGLTYGATLEPEFGAWESGVVTLATDATPSTLAHAIAAALGVLATATQTPIPATELEPWRQGLVSAFPFRFETVADTANQYVFLESARLPYAWLTGWRDALARPSAADIQRVLANVLAADRLVLVAVGPARLAPLLAPDARIVRIVSARDLLTSGLQAATPAP
jgi:zinc protease